MKLSLIFIYRFKQGRIPELNFFAAIINWIWPYDRCTNCQSIYSITTSERDNKNLSQIHRSADGRFIVADSVDGSRRNSSGSQNTSSDDGGFLQRRQIRGRALWRRPLVSCPSQLSFRSEGSGQSRSGRGLLSGLRIGGGRPTNLLQTVPIIHHKPINQNLHINTISASLPTPLMLSPYTPSRISRFHASSPAVSSVIGITSPWTPMYFSDLSSVRQPSSAERSFPTPQSGVSLSRSMYERYTQELPSLRAIHEEARRMTQGFVPVHVPMHSPATRGYHSQHGYRPKLRLLPRHARARSAPDLASPTTNLNSTLHLETSPASRSSSSGFGSKNTSSQQNQSSQSGSTNEWRALPPYRPPPPPPSSVAHHHHHHHLLHHHNPNYTGYKSPTPPYSMGHWLDLITRLNAASEKANLTKAVDVGSVDGHYEFDPATPTPTASTPTGTRDEIIIDPIGLQYRKRVSRYDNIDARVQAMKEEFYAYRKRQTMRRPGVELESAC